MYTAYILQKLRMEAFAELTAPDLAVVANILFRANYSLKTKAKNWSLKGLELVFCPPKHLSLERFVVNDQTVEKPAFFTNPRLLNYPLADGFLGFIFNFYIKIDSREYGRTPEGITINVVPHFSSPEDVTFPLTNPMDLTLHYS